MPYKITKESKATHIKKEFYANDYYQAKQIYNALQENINKNNDFFITMEAV